MKLFSFYDSIIWVGGQRRSKWIINDKHVDQNKRKIVRKEWWWIIKWYLLIKFGVHVQKNGGESKVKSWMNRTHFGRELLMGWNDVYIRINDNAYI